MAASSSPIIRWEEPWRLQSGLVGAETDDPIGGRQHLSGGCLWSDQTQIKLIRQAANHRRKMPFRCLFPVRCKRCCDRSGSRTFQKKHTIRTKNRKSCKKIQRRATSFKSGAGQLRSISDFINDFNSYFVSLVNLSGNKTKSCSNITQIWPVEIYATFSNEHPHTAHNMARMGQVL